MEIIFENLAKLRYSFKKAHWTDGKSQLIFVPACQTCGRPFLGFKNNPINAFCSKACKVTGALNPHYIDGRTADPDYSVKKSARFRRKNPGYYSQWAQENRDKVNAGTARRRARLLGQTPEDASKEKIDWFFKVAANLRESTGKPWHVDHIHPLSEDGPHHEDNLQVLPGKENLRKRAKVGLEPTGITIEVYYKIMDAFDFLYSIACPEQ